MVVTGASSGIGESVARQWGALGHPVVLGARRVDVCAAVAAEIGSQAHALALDLSDPASVAEFCAACAERVGEIEVLVSNAGDVLPTRTVDTAPEVFAHQVAVNLLGAQQLIAALVPGMIERRRGDVVVVSSDVVRAPRPNMSSYVSSKWGLDGLAQALQMELEGSGVRCSVVRPGPTLTGMGMSWDPATVGSVINEWRRWGLIRHDGYLGPEDVAAAVLHVASVPPGVHLSVVEVQPEAPVRTEQR